ncbi:MAG: alpha/beta hydrolase [Deltaproteobacteria bacterium]|nr:alpha/beta hydrolase [Deltaproteobacteria bacterium]
MAQSCATQISRRTFQTSDGVTLSLLEAGSQHTKDSNITIALITGWSMPAAIWQNQIEHFSRRYHTLALDPRGQGESEVPAAGFTAERRAADLQEFLAPLKNVLLVGWSLGAIESLQYLHMFGAERLAGLVLVDSSVGEEPAPAPGGTFLQALRDERDKTLDGFVRAIFKKPLSEDEVARLIGGAKRMPVESSIALLSYPFPRTHWKEIAHAFKKPLLYVVTPQFEEQAQNLQKNRPGTQVEVFKDAGHTLFVDEAERFNALIEKFAASLSRR